jgi:UDP-N-acetylmuramoylalanine--D-glutamate ligase
LDFVYCVGIDEFAYFEVALNMFTLSSEALAHMQGFLRDVRGKTVGVLGLGVAGCAMVQRLRTLGAHVVGIDDTQTAPSQTVLDWGIPLRVGQQAHLQGLDALCVSPGVDPRRSDIALLRAQGVPVLGELMLAQPVPARVVGITGTNGKSTTSALIDALLRALGVKTFLGGNFGTPVVTWIESGVPADVAVLELSSFQLETAYACPVDVGVVLNVTADHVDRYSSLEEYASAKQRLVENVTSQGVAVLNADDAWVRGMARVCEGQVWWFSPQGNVVEGTGVRVGPHETMQGFGAMSAWKEYPLKHPYLIGSHNRENAMAAFLAVCALGYGGQAEALLDGYLGFHGLEHRLEYVAQVRGVRYINDSKATNDASAAIGLAAVEGPVVLLVGGKDKGAGYQQLVHAAQGKVKAVLAFGAAKEAVAADFHAHPHLEKCDALMDACERAAQIAVDGDTVLLSPACSSFDAFKNYMHRGQVFKEWVKRL